MATSVLSSWSKPSLLPRPPASAVSVTPPPPPTNGQPGSGLLWITDASNGALRVLPAVPLQRQHVPYLRRQQDGGNKWQRAVPGNGRMFIVSQAAW